MVHGDFRINPSPRSIIRIELYVHVETPQGFCTKKGASKDFAFTTDFLNSNEII